MIINSLLDTDFYKFTMGQYIWKYSPKTKVKFAFKNRTKDVKLGYHIFLNELKEQIFHVSNLRFTFDELQYLKDTGKFCYEYLNFLNTLKLPPVYCSLSNGELVIETEGNWGEVSYWETFILSIVNQLYGNKQKERSFVNIGCDNLEKKINKIQKNPFNFVDFGTRRRASNYWQETVLIQLKIDFKSKYFLGTSNVYFAKKLELKPIGTFAHELTMVLCGINPCNMKAAHRVVLRDWYRMYGEELSIALTDTYGTDFFFKEGLEYPKKWRGLRQDSGNPFTFGVKAIEYYEKLGVDPKEKTIVFSDGLDVDTIISLENQFKGKIKTVYGWGTNLTNDCGVKPLSIVMKAVEADGLPLIKLSDNLSKATGELKEIDRCKKVFGYINDLDEQPVY